MANPTWQDLYESGAGTARVDCDLRAISIHENRYDIVWVGEDNSVQGSRYIDEWRDFPVSNEGVSLAGTPIGISKWNKFYEVFFRAWHGGIVIAEWTAPGGEN